MQLLNTTPLVASLSLVPQGNERRGLFVAKATFRLEQGKLRLDANAPEGLRAADEPHALGMLPREIVERPGDDLEVVLLGCAHAPRGREVGSMRVGLSVCGVRRELEVFGDRVWVGDSVSARIGAPAPFAVMPLTWSRAFGGRAWIEVDVESFMEVAHQDNPDGKGFDVARHAREVREALRAPGGLAAPPQRTLPNVELPDARIAAWGDAPRPAGWAPLPVRHPLRLERTRPPDDLAGRGDLEALALYESPLRFHAAVSEWILPEVHGPISLELDGLTREPVPTLTLPALELRLEILVGEAMHLAVPRPHLLLLRPDEGMVTLTYRASFSLPAPAGAVRRARLLARPSALEEALS